MSQYIEGPCNCVSSPGNVCRHKPKLQTYRILGQAKHGLLSITLEAIDHPSAVTKATKRGIDVHDCVLIKNVYGVKQ